MAFHRLCLNAVVGLRFIQFLFRSIRATCRQPNLFRRFRGSHALITSKPTAAAAAPPCRGLPAGRRYRGLVQAKKSTAFWGQSSFDDEVIAVDDFIPVGVGFEELGEFGAICGP